MFYVINYLIQLFPGNRTYNGIKTIPLKSRAEYALLNIIRSKEKHVLRKREYFKNAVKDISSNYTVIERVYAISVS